MKTCVVTRNNNFPINLTVLEDWNRCGRLVVFYCHGSMPKLLLRAEPLSTNTFVDALDVQFFIWKHELQFSLDFRFWVKELVTFVNKSDSAQNIIPTVKLPHLESGGIHVKKHNMIWLIFNAIWNVCSLTTKVYQLIWRSWYVWKGPAEPLGRKLCVETMFEVDQCEIVHPEENIKENQPNVLSNPK